MQDVGLRRPTLDDVFLALTGRTTDDTTDPTDPTDDATGLGAGDRPASAGRVLEEVA